MSLSLRTILFTLAGLLLLPAAAFAQWSGTGPVYTDDNVGIGTTNPNYTLDLVGDIELKHAGAEHNSYYFRISKSGALRYDAREGEGDVKWLMDWGNTFHIDGGATAGDPVFRVDENDTYPAVYVEGSSKVGVGTASPQSRFHVDRGAMRVTNPGDGNALLTFDTERDWAFQQLNSGQYTALKLRSIGGGGNKNFVIDTDGAVGIGTDAPKYKLSVNGTVRSKEVLVESQNWPDFVFTDAYDLPTLDEVAAHVDAEGHLPGVPSAASAEANGVKVGAMQRTLLQKIEELTLYAIDREEQAEKQNQTIEALKEQVQTQQRQIQQQKRQLQQQQRQIQQLLEATQTSH
jgi:hypothetical protein